MRKLNRIYNVIIYSSFAIVLLAILALVLNVTRLPVEILSASGICCTIGGISFLIGKIDYNKKLK